MQRNFVRRATMVMMAAGALCLSVSAPAAEGDAKLRSIVDGAHRPAESKVRDKYRHPVETLTFFGIKDTMTVVELWPFGGWYTQILAPYLRDTGKYYAAATDSPPGGGLSRYDVELQKLLAGNPKLYDKVNVTVLSPGKKEVAPAGSADLVLTFRNIHNWTRQGIDKQVFEEAFRALKPGGILGVVEHRADPHPTGTPGGYVAEKDAIALVESAGFKLVAKSEINANPRDTKDYPKGVWTLPPAYAEGDKDKAKYTAIGESDRFTLKFQKPAG